VKVFAAAAAGASLCAMAACAHFQPNKDVAASVSPSPAQPWQPPAQAREPLPGVKPPPPVPEEWKTQGATLSLAKVIELALENNPATSAAWYQARAAAAQVGVKRAQFFPEIDLGAGVTRQKQSAVGGRFTFQQTTYGPVAVFGGVNDSGPSANLTYILLDFGGRGADVDEAREALYSADWSHDSVIQDVVLGVVSRYYDYLNAKALVTAQQASVKEGEENLEAATERHRAGVATIADVLQAKTDLSQAQLALETVEGQIQTTRGALATALGFPASYASLPVEVGELPETVDVRSIEQKVDSLIEQAQSERPDLAAARAEVLRSEAHIRSVRSQGLPTLGLSAYANRTYYNSPGSPFSTNYSGTLSVTVPIFKGLSNVYGVLESKEEAQATRQRYETLQQQVILQVWTSYYDLKTAGQRVSTARDLLESAKQSEEVASGRYKNGVGNILDLLTAQRSLALARAEDATARSDWFLAIAQLAYSTGLLRPASNNTIPALPWYPKQGD
jgi:outer membrane protein TolC